MKKIKKIEKRERYNEIESQKETIEKEKVSLSSYISLSHCAFL